MLLNDDIEDIEKADGISLLTFVVDNVSELVFHSSFFYQRFKICINNKLCFIKFVVLINCGISNILVFSEGIATLQKYLYSDTLYYFFLLFIFFSDTFLCNSNLYFYFEGMKTIQIINITIIF